MLNDLLAERGFILADGATGTNYFDRGLVSGDAPELWNVEAVDRVAGLHREFIDAGADMVLTNSFGANSRRLRLHGAEDRARELNERAAAIARETADASGRTVIVAGSIGPSGDLFAPLGELTYEEAVAVFAEQAAGLRDGGADILWVETMSAPEEIRAAADAIADIGLPFVYTASFDTAGRTMMGLAPAALPALSDSLAQTPAGYGANCGVGAPDLLVAVLEIAEAAPDAVLIAKGNCGIPEIKGDHVHYTGTPELMADYTTLAIDAGARIIGGCCGTTPEHVAAMRVAMDSHRPDARPTRESITARLGPMIMKQAAPGTEAGEARSRRRSRRRAS